MNVSIMFPAVTVKELLPVDVEEGSCGGGADCHAPLAESPGFHEVHTVLDGVLVEPDAQGEDGAAKVEVIDGRISAGGVVIGDDVSRRVVCEEDVAAVDDQAATESFLVVVIVPYDRENRLLCWFPPHLRWQREG